MERYKGKARKGSMASSSSTRRLPQSILHPPSTRKDSKLPSVDSPKGGPSSAESDKFHPWLWIIQSVACCKELEIATLQEMVDTAPIEKDDFCDKTRELIALRCLEHLYEFSHAVNGDVASAGMDSRVRIDFSRSCEDVVLQIFDKVPSPTMKKVREEVLKWDVFPFLKHKRATLTSDLEQLLELVSDGTHPLSQFIREHGGLADQNKDHPVHVNDNERSVVSEKNGNKSSKESLNEQIIPSERNRVGSAGKHEKLGEINERGDLLKNAKKISCNASLNVESKKEKPFSRHGKQVLENTTENFLLVSERGECHTDKDCGAEISSDTDWHDNDTDDFAAKKHEFLSSHYLSASTRLPEKDLCMKCKEVGELLVCKTATCPIMVHKTCVSPYAQIDEEGNFICPYCAYHRATSEYHEAKKEASLARTELAFFICKDLLHQETQLHHEVIRKKRSLSKKKSKPRSNHQSRQKQCSEQPKRKS